MLPAHGRVLGHSLLAFHHQEELPPQRGSGHLPLPKLQFVVLPLECREPEGMRVEGSWHHGGSAHLPGGTFGLWGSPPKGQAHLWESGGLGRGPGTFASPPQHKESQERTWAAG